MERDELPGGGETACCRPRDRRGRRRGNRCRRSRRRRRTGTARRPPKQPARNRRSSGGAARRPRSRPRPGRHRRAIRGRSARRSGARGPSKPYASGRSIQAIRPSVSAMPVRSFPPDSASSVRASVRRMCVERIVAKTAAASVAATTAPSRNDSSHVRSKSQYAATPVRTVETPTPTVLRRAAGTATWRRRRHEVCNPPSKRISASPTIPTRRARLRVVELDSTRPLRPEQHPEYQEHDEHRQPRPRRHERQNDAGSEDEAEEQEDRGLRPCFYLPRSEATLQGLRAIGVRSRGFRSCAAVTGSHGRRVEHFLDGDASSDSQDRPAVGNRAGRGPARLRLLLRAAQADGHPAVDVA